MAQQTTEIRTQQDLNRFLGEVVVDYLNIDYMPFLEETTENLEVLHDNYFRSETGPGPTPWPQLAPSTIDKKGHSQILVDTDRLRSSLVGRTGDSIRDLFDEEGHAWILFGTEVDYSEFHNDPDGPLPYRPHAGLADADVTGIAEQVLDYQVENLRAGRVLT